MALFPRAPLLCAAFFAIAPLLSALVENEVQMTIYIRQVRALPEPLNDIVVVDHRGFGTISVNDWAILDGPDPSTAKVVGRAQGIHMWSSGSEFSWYTSMNLVFKDECMYNGSTLQVMGITPYGTEWSIVGGTGQLSMARGIIKSTFDPKTAFVADTTIFKCDVHAYYFSLDSMAVDGKISNSKSSEPIAEN